MANARVRRGRATQTVAAEYLQRHGWPDATPVAAFLPGSDILGIPTLHLEVKGTAGIPLLGALRQAVDGAGDSGRLPAVLWRPNGYGETRVADWVFALRLGDAAPILRRAGL